MSVYLSPEHLYQGICIRKLGDAESLPRGGSGTIIISSLDSCIYPPIIPPTCPCLTTTTKVSSQKVFFCWEAAMKKR